MTPAARVQTAIEILDEIAAGTPVERALTTWARRSRFAGSKDRAAVRDHVYDVIRQKKSCEAAGQGKSGRALMVGLLALQGFDASDLFTAAPYAPEKLNQDEVANPSAAEGVLDLPDWAIPEMKATLGTDFTEVETLLKSRSDVHLRCNLAKNTRSDAMALLEDDGVMTTPHPISDTGLVVREGARKVSQSRAYKCGAVELQDASSQAAIQALPLKDGMRILDYCAGGGGKLLAMAARIKGTFHAHDANPQRMRDLPERAKRAGVKAKTLTAQDLINEAAYDLVFCDVPCSGSGSWRRDPEGKWRMSSNDFKSLLTVQSDILERAQHLVAQNGYLVYATCSLCQSENADQLKAFVANNPVWSVAAQKQWTPVMGCDGFFLTVFLRN